MARQALGLIAALAFTVGGAFAAGEPERDPKTPQTPWARMAPDDRRVLAPLQSEWDSLPGYQQQRLQSAARQYPKMQPIQRERFQDRIQGWANMSPDQRKAARDTFQGMRKLPPEKQHELRERWFHKREAGEPSPPPEAARSRPPSTKPSQ